MSGINDGGYRDARAGLTQRIADAEHAIAHCDERIAPALLRLLPDDQRHELRVLRDEPPAKDDSFEELTRVADSREALADALSRAIAFAPVIQADLRIDEAPPSAPPQEDMWGPIGTEEAMVPTLESARAIAKSIDEDAVVTCIGPRITVRLHEHGVPILWCIEATSVLASGNGNAKFLAAKHLLETRVSTELPRLEIHSRTWGLALLRALAIRRDLETGDEEFDRELAISGDEDFALPLLSKAVRAALTVRAKAGKFSLISDRGVAAIRYRESLFDPSVDDRFVVSAVTALARLHESAAHFSLVREAP